MRKKSSHAARFAKFVCIVLPGMFAIVTWRPAMGQQPGSQTPYTLPVSPLSANASAGADAENRLPADMEQAFRWLPEDTEVVIVARGPSVRDEKNGPPEDSPFPSRRQGFRALMLDDCICHFNVAGKAFRRDINNHRIRFALRAARRFGPITGIPGGSPFEGCQLIVFDDPLPDVGVQPEPPNTVAVVETEGNRIIRVYTDVDWGSNSRLSTYIAKPSPNVLIAASDFGFLKTMLRRMAHPTASRALPAELPEWKGLNTEAPVWGVSHSRRDPLAAHTLRVTYGDQFSGITFSYETQPFERVAIRFHGERSLDLLARIAGKDWNTVHISPNVAETQIRIYPDVEAPTAPRRPGRHTAGAMAFYMQVLMGFIVCP